MTESRAVELLKNNEERRTAGTYIVVKHLSIIALEKQIAKKPVKKSFIVPYEGINVCPSCKQPLDDKRHYCSKCGQKLDWSDEE